LVVFPDDSVALDDEGKLQIDGILPKLVGMPQKIEIRGHASRRPIKTDVEPRDPWHVSYERCLAVKKYLEEKGIEPNRLRLTQAGVYEPFTIQGGNDGQPRNSRVEVFLLAELADDLVGTAEERAQRYRDEDTVVKADATVE
jgi:chemotaxis protein MotB